MRFSTAYGFAFFRCAGVGCLSVSPPLVLISARKSFALNGYLRVDFCPVVLSGTSTRRSVRPLLYATEPRGSAWPLRIKCAPGLKVKYRLKSSASFLSGSDAGVRKGMRLGRSRACDCERLQSECLGPMWRHRTCSSPSIQFGSEKAKIAGLYWKSVGCV
jgi:hypothetical protein